MPAPFAYELCGYRPQAKAPALASDKPNMSDASEKHSVELSRALLNELGVPISKVSPEESAGSHLEEQVVTHLRAIRPDLRIQRGRHAREFAQYAHLDVFPKFKKTFRDLQPTIARVKELVGAIEPGPMRRRVQRDVDKLAARSKEQAELVADLVEQMPSESLLKIDITVAIPHEGQLDELAIALSSKWSLRTDRAQDCVSQGSKLVSQRRGRMPHYGVITIEPRPHMLRILADGSGAVDFVYHLDLPALSRAVAADAEGKTGRSLSPALSFARLLRQNRLRDWDDLVSEVVRLPAPQPSRGG